MQDAGDDGFDGLALLLIELGDGLELEFEALIGPSLILLKKQHICAHAEREVDPYSLYHQMRPFLERYQRYLFLYRKKNGEALSGRSQHMRLVPVKVWFRWLVRNHRILSNPAADIDMPRVEKRLPRHVLSAEEAERILNVPDVTSSLGIRDQAMLETFYSTGMRRAELVGLHVHDGDHERGTVMIREGKGKRSRLIPIGERALAWIRKYLDEVRPQIALANDEGALFLALTGDSIGTRSLGLLVSDYIKRSGVDKPGSCHLFRHTMATLMLENGADVRFVQVMLGHAQLTSTQIYT